jgi:tRNA/rRNA methyltransferase
MRVQKKTPHCMQPLLLAAKGPRSYDAGMTEPVIKPTLPAIVLVRPQMGENIGAAARAMWNFGLDHMRVVAPRDGWPNPSAVAMASGAGRLLDQARLCPDLPDALADCDFVYATTARDRDLTKPVFSPEAAMQDAAARIAAGQRVAILFGPERAGLENDDIARANAIVSVPVNPAFPSLNLAQCVLLMGYEWMRQTGMVAAQTTEMAGTDWASGAEVEHLAIHYEDRMEDAWFFYPDHKAISMKVNLRNMWSRMPLTRADVQMFHGMMRQMVRWKERG